jgi:glycine cleavage system H protein
MDPRELRFTETHEWVDLRNGIATVGITQFAVDQLTDLVHVELPQVGHRVVAGQPFGEIESVKAVSDLYSPVSGQVIEVNEALRQRVTLVSEDPYGAGWMIRVRVDEGTTIDHLLTYEQYQQQIAGAA